MQNKPRKSCTRPAENKSLFPIPSTHPSNHPPFSTIIPIIVLIFQQLSPRSYLRIFYDTFMINRVTTQLRQSNHYCSQLFFISQITVCKFVVRIAYFFFLSRQYFLTTFDPAAISGKNIRYYTASEINYDPSLQSRHVSLQGNHAR